MGAEVFGDEFENGLIVVVESSDDFVVDVIGDMDQIEEAAQFLEMVFGFRSEVVEDGGGFLDELFVFWVFGIEDPKGVFLKAGLIRVIPLERLLFLRLAHQGIMGMVNIL